MTADLDVLLREVDDVKQQLANHNGVDVDSNAIFESLEQNGFRENRVEFVVRQFLGEDELNEVDRTEHDNGIECVAIVNIAKTADLTTNVAEKNTPSLNTNGNISVEVIKIDSESDSDSSVEVLIKKNAKAKRKCNSTLEPNKKKKEECKNSFDSYIQAISSEPSKDASASNTDHITYDLCDVNNNDPNNNFEPESFIQQTGTLSAEQAIDESEFLHLPSTSKANNAPSCSFQPSVITNVRFKDSSKEDLLSDNDGDMPQLNNEDLLELNQEGIREALLEEARFIHNRVPHQHLDEIFSYLEANLDNEDRLNIVLLNFLQRDKQKDDSGQQKQLPSLLTSEFSEKANTVTNSKSDVEPNCIANTYSAEVEICSTSDAIKTKIDTVMNTENVTSTSDIPMIDFDYALETQVANRVSTSTVLDLTNETFKENEEKVVQKYITTLTEMFPNLPKKQLEQHCKKMRLNGGSLEDLILKLLETDSKSEVKEVPPEDNLARYLPEKHSVTENSSSAVRNNSHPSVSVVDSTSFREQEEEEEEEVEELRYKTLLAIFPDADPDFLRENASTLPQDDESFRDFITTNLENKGYPSLKDYEQRQERAAIKKKYGEDFSVQAFLDVFPDPLNYFKERKSLYDKKIKDYAVNYLKNKFRWLRMEILKDIYNKNEDNLTKAFEELQCIQNNHNKKKKGRKEFRLSRRLVAEYPKVDELDVSFLQELAFLDHKDEIDAYLKEKTERRQRAFEEAKKNGDLLECACCYDNEILSEDIRPCDEGHLFCKDCVKRSAEIAIGEGKMSFPCLTSCKSEFSLKVLQTVLKPDIFSKMLKRKQLEEIKQAGIEGLETCPFCDFASILEEGNKIFQCLNPECMKESCRACRQPSHIPLKCEEVEKADEVKMRIYIEDRMTQALVRECCKCRQKFVKEDGCNKMKCHCGAMMCYICRKPVKDYSHFNGQGGTDYHKCPLYSNNDELHVTAVELEGLKAKREVEQQNPDLKLKHDPTKNIPKTKYVPIGRNRMQNNVLFQLRDAMMICNRKLRRNDLGRMRGMIESLLHPEENGREMYCYGNYEVPPVQAAYDVRANEMEPLPLDMPINDERPILCRVDELDHYLPNNRKHVARYLTLPHYHHSNHTTHVMPVRRESLNIADRPIIPVHQNVQTLRYVLPGSAKQTMPAYHNKLFPGGRKRPMPAHHNVQTCGCSLPSPVKQRKFAHQNVQTPGYILPRPVKQPMPAHQNMQTPGCSLLGPVKQPIPAHHNLEIPGCSLSAPVQPMAIEQNIHTPEYILPGPVKQPMPAHQNVQTQTLGYTLPGPVKQPMPAHQNVQTQTPGYTLPSRVKKLPLHPNVQITECIQPGPARPAQPNVHGAFEFIQPDACRQDAPP